MTSGGIEFGNETDAAQRLRTGGGATSDNDSVVGGKGTVGFQETLRVEEGGDPAVGCRGRADSALFVSRCASTN